MSGHRIALLELAQDVSYGAVKVNAEVAGIRGAGYSDSGAHAGVEGPRHFVMGCVILGSGRRIAH